MTTSQNNDQEIRDFAARTRVPYFRWDENEDDLVRPGDCDCTYGRYVQIGSRDYAERWEIVEHCPQHSRDFDFA